MNMVQGRKLVLTLAATFGLMLAMFGALFAASPAGAQAVDAHPAHVHTGACPAPGAVVFPLSDVSVEILVDGTPTAGSKLVGQANPLTVETSSMTVKAKLVDLLDGQHSIVIHQSATDMGTYLVCGNVGGTKSGSDAISIGLSPVKNSGYIGVAKLVDNGDGTTTVNLFLMKMPAVAGSGTGGTTAGSGGNGGSTTTGNTANGTGGNTANSTDGNSANSANNTDSNSANPARTTALTATAAWTTALTAMAAWTTAPTAMAAWATAPTAMAQTAIRVRTTTAPTATPALATRARATARTATPARATAVKRAPRTLARA